MGESGLNIAVVKGDKENIKGMEGKLSICQNIRKVTALEGRGPQKRFNGKKVKECTGFLHILEAT